MTNSFFKHSLLSLVIFVSFGAVILPTTAFALWKPGDPVVPCGTQRVVDSTGNASIPESNVCQFKDLIQLGKNIMDILIWIGVPLAAILFAYAGGVLIFSGGNEKARDKAKAIFWTVGIGLIIMLVAYTVMYTIATSLLESKYYQDFLNGPPSGPTGPSDPVS